jgi:hypothetical protein
MQTGTENEKPKNPERCTTTSLDADKMPATLSSMAFA